MKKVISQRISYHVRTYDYSKNNSRVGFYMSVTIDRNTKKIPLDIYFYKELYDTKSEQIRLDGINNKEITDLNLMINQEKGKINSLLRQYRIAEWRVTHEQLKRDFLNYASLDNFIAWADTLLEELKISTFEPQTYKNKRNRLNHFVKFANNKPVLFADLTPRLITDFDIYLPKKSGLAHNSLTAVHVTIKHLIKYAISEGVSVDNPYNEFKIKKYTPGKREALDLNEVKVLKELYNSGTLTGLEHEVLRKFLFSCFTGLRISDSQIVTYEDIDDDILRMETVKGKRFGKVTSIKLTEYPLSLIAGKERGLIFKPLADPLVNRTLKTIAAKAEIKKNLTFHVSRDTFGTVFIDLGGDLVSLQKLMGHSDIKTTTIYVKNSERRRNELMQNFNAI